MGESREAFGLMAHLDAEVLRWEVGRRLGVCDLSGEQMDARTAVLLEDGQGRTLAVVRPDAWLRIRTWFLADHPDTVVKNAPTEENR